VALCFQLGKEQAAVHLHFKTATIGRHQVNALDLRLEIMQQFLQQANGPVGIVSNCTVGDFDIEQHFLFLVGVGWLKIIT